MANNGINVYDIIESDKIKHCYIAVLRSSGSVLGWTFDERVMDVYKAQRSPKKIKVIKIDKEDAVDKFWVEDRRRIESDEAEVLVPRFETRSLRLDLIDIDIENDTTMKIAVSEEEYNHMNMLEEALLDIIPQLRESVIDIFMDKDDAEDEFACDIIFRLPDLLNRFFVFPLNQPTSGMINKYKLFLVVCNDTLFDEDVFGDRLERLDEFLDY